MRRIEVCGGERPGGDPSEKSKTAPECGCSAGTLGTSAITSSTGARLHLVVRSMFGSAASLASTPIVFLQQSSLAPGRWHSDILSLQQAIAEGSPCSQYRTVSGASSTPMQRTEVAQDRIVLILGARRLIMFILAQRLMHQRTPRIRFRRQRSNPKGGCVMHPDPFVGSKVFPQ